MDKEMKVKYSSLPREEINNETADGNIKMEEKSPLLENMERLSISSPIKFDHDNEKDNVSRVASVKEHDDTSRRQTNMTPKTDAEDLENDETNKTTTQQNKKESVNVNKSAEHVIHVGKSLEKKNEKTNSADDTIDIVRKMSEATSEGYIPWQKIGFYRSLKLHRCQRVYAKSKRADDLVLLFNNGKFFIMEAWCSHMGGPLFEGDIEDYNGKCHIMCPWHSYMFDLETGKNEIGLEQKVYALKYENGFVYVRYHSELSVEPYEVSRKISEAVKRETTCPTKSHKKVVARKESILENVMKL